VAATQNNVSKALDIRAFRNTREADFGSRRSAKTATLLQS